MYLPRHRSIRKENGRKKKKIEKKREIRK